MNERVAEASFVVNISEAWLRIELTDSKSTFTNFDLILARKGLCAYSFVTRSLVRWLLPVDLKEGEEEDDD